MNTLLASASLILLTGLSFNTQSGEVIDTNCIIPVAQAASTVSVICPDAETYCMFYEFPDGRGGWDPPIAEVGEETVVTP